MVKFNGEVKMHKLVAPTEIYHALFPRTIGLQDTFDPPIRKLSNNLFCVCNKCRLLLAGCTIEAACDNCFGRASANNTH